MAKKVTALLATATVLLLGACSNQQTPSSSQSNIQVTDSEAKTTNTQGSSSDGSSNSSSLNTTNTQVTQGNIDGTYKGVDESDQITLVVTGNTGTWTAVEPDGEQEIKPVKLDAANQSIIIGDDAYRYRLEGQQLTLEDFDQELYDDDTIVLTKQ